MMSKYYKLLIAGLIYLFPISVSGQSFTNGDLNGTVNFTSVPSGWTQIPESDPVCQANTPPEATVDILDATGPNLAGGVAGNPFSGSTFCSGLHASDNISLLWHEGIMQTVSGFTVGNSYTICFYQAVVKQQNCLDGSGSWRVYVDGSLIATTAVSTSSLTFDDVNLQWDNRTVTFTATAATHTIQFIPFDDDADLTNSSSSPNGGLRMGIDLITIVSPIDPTIDPVGPFCISEPAVNLTAADPGGTWSGTGITNPAVGTFDPSVSGVGSFIITYSFPGACGANDTVLIDVTSSQDATINPAGPFCLGEPPVNLTAVDPGGTWSGTGITDAVNGTFDPATAGVGTFTITYSIGGSCGDTQTASITVTNNMDATINPAGPFCTSDAPVNLTAVDPGGTWSGTGITDAVNGTFDPAITGVGTFTITYSIGGSCGDTQTSSITVTNNFDASINPAGPFCSNDSPVNLSAVNAGGIWSGPGIIDTVNGTFDPSVAGQGTHTITYTISGACGDTQTEDMIVNSIPVPDFTFDVNSGCAPLTVTFTDVSVPAVTDASWLMSDGFTSSSLGSVTHTFTSVGCFDVTLQTTSAQGCSSALTQNGIICTYATPIADFSFSPQPATIFEPEINFTNESVGAIIYDWDFGGLGSSNAVDTSFSFPYDQPGNYLVCLTATNAGGCYDTTCHTIEILDEFYLYVPNSFTPNGDGRNDLFYPVLGGYDINSYEFLVFNRWGELIFKSQNGNEGWNGMHKGIKCQEDVYVWKIKLMQTNSVTIEEFYGHVTLVR